MYGAIIGDIVGSRYEGVKGRDMFKEFDLFTSRSKCTDDSVMTIAVADALANSGMNPEIFGEILPGKMREWGRKYPRAGYGGMFRQWLKSDDMESYNSFGNGSAMRVSPCGLVALTLEQALDLAKRSAEVTHDHPEGIKGAQAIAACIYLAKTGKSIDEIKTYVEENFYKLDRSIEELRKNSIMDATCQVTVPMAIRAFVESTDYEDAIRNGVYVGGDTDTIAAMAGSIAWTYYKKQNGDDLTMEMDCLKDYAEEYIPNDIKEKIVAFDAYKLKCDRLLDRYNVSHGQMSDDDPE